MWIRILGGLYNLSLVQAIEYNTKEKELYLHYGVVGSYTGTSQTSSFHSEEYTLRDTTTISFALPQYGNEYGLAVYAQLIKKLKVFDSDPVESDRILGIAGPPNEGAHPDAEFIEG